MTLVQDFKENTKIGGWPNHDEIADELGAKQVDYDILDTTRWGEIVSYVYKRADEYVRVTYERASGDGDSYYDPRIEVVVPEQKTITTYKVVKT